MAKKPPRPTRGAFAPQDPLTAPFKVTPQQQATVREIRSRQGAKQAGIIGRRVSAQAGLPAPTSTPFGHKGGGADPYQIDLTAKTELAKANVSRAGQGGLLTPAQRKREQTAERVVVNNANQTTFHERKDLGALAKPNWRERLAAAEAAAPPPPPPSPTRAPARGPRTGMAAYYAKQPKGRSIGDVVSTALGTTLEGLGSVPGTLLTPMRVGYSGGGLGSSAHPPVMDVRPTHLGTAAPDVLGRLGRSSTELASGIGRWGLSTPNVSIGIGEVDPASQAAMTKRGQTRIPAGQLGSAVGFTPQATQRYLAMALKRGWYKGEVENLNGLDLLEHAYNAPPPMALRIAQNAAVGVARTGAVGSAFYGIGQQVASGHVGQAAGELAKVAGDYVGALAHPKEALVSDPYGYAPLPGLALKGLGTVGYLTKAAEDVGTRSVKLGLHPEGFIGPQRVISRGTYSRNLATAAGQHLSDRFAETIGKNAAFSGHVDSLVRRATNEAGAAHQIAQLEYRRTQRAVGKKRSELLLAYQHAGGKTSEIASMYDRQALKHATPESSPAAGAARFYRDKVMPATQQLSEADRAFLDAHRNLSEQTSNTLIGLGRFSSTAKLYRQHEPLILAAAEAGDEAALHILYLRKELEHDIPIDAPQGSPRLIKRGGKLSEAQRTGTVTGKDHAAQVKILNEHPRPVAPQRAHDPEHEAAMADWKAAEPKLPKKSKLTSEEQAARIAPKMEAWKASKPKRTPLSEEERAAWVKHRAEMADWKKNWETKHATATVKERAYRKAADVGNRRAGLLHEADLEQWRKVPDQQDIFNQYDAALKDFADQHVASGGEAPARVAYTKGEVRPSAYRRAGTGARSFIRKPSGRQQPSTGQSFLSGNYLIDSRSPILDNLRAQRLHASIGSYQLVMQHLAVAAKKDEHVPDGFVFVKGSNAAALGRVEHELESNPVGHSDHYGSEHSVRQDFVNALHDATSSNRIAKEDGFFVPIGAWRRMTQYATPESQGLYSSFLRDYQRALISIFPSTVLGNTLGTIPLALAGGGRGLVTGSAWRDAWRSRGGSRLTGLGDPSIAPASSFGRGVAGGLASDARNVATHHMDRMRRLSVGGEDFGRRLAFFAKASPHIRARARELEMESDDYARSFVRGEIYPHKLEEFLNHAESFLGDTVKPNGEIARGIGKVIMFHNWVGHMAKLMLYTLPVKHPGTAAIINILAQYGDQYRRKHGVWPSWMTDYIPIGHYAHNVPGGAQQFTSAFNLGQLMPQSTAGGLFENLAQDRPLQERLAGVVGPPWSQGLDVLKQGVINHYGSDSNHANLWKTALNLALGIIPGERKRYPMQGRKPDDLELLGQPSYKMYTSRVPGIPLSPYLQPGSVPRRGWTGFIERSLAGGVYGVPNAGPITDTQNYKNVMRHITATIHAPTTELAKKRKEAIYKAMRERGVQNPAALLP